MRTGQNCTSRLNFTEPKLHKNTFARKQFCIGDKIAWGDKSGRRQVNTNGQFCTSYNLNESKKTEKKLLKKKAKKSYFPKVRVRGNSDSKNN